MPNHIQSRITVTGNDQSVQEFFKAISGDKTTIDFKKIIPPPDNMFSGNLSSEDQARCDRQGIPTWYKWQTENWGTKWNAYQTDDKRNTKNAIYFQTASAAPMPIFEKLAGTFPQLKIEIVWADEDSGSNTGEAWAENGKLFVRRIENQSKEAYDLYFELHPDMRRYYDLVDGEYEYKEENE
jgi:hypothetical protein